MQALFVLAVRAAARARPLLADAVALGPARPAGRRHARRVLGARARLAARRVRGLARHGIPDRRLGARHAAPRGGRCAANVLPLIAGVGDRALAAGSPASAAVPLRRRDGRGGRHRHRGLEPRQSRGPDAGLARVRDLGPGPTTACRPIDAFVSGMWRRSCWPCADRRLWCVRRRQWCIPLGALIFLAIWPLSDRTQSPYVAAKALVILSPLLLLLAALPLAGRRPARDASALRGRWRAPVLAVAVVAARASRAGTRCASARSARAPTPRAALAAPGARASRPLPRQRRLRALGAGRCTRRRPRVQLPELPTRPEKPWAVRAVARLRLAAA